jgi:Family of unknown function (DUF6279)
VARLPRKVISALLLLMLTGCSGTTFVYNRLDFLIPWYVGKYVDLTRLQKQLLDEQLDPFLQWHRYDELPAYLQILDQIEATLDDGVRADQIASIVAEIEVAGLRLERSGLEWMIVLGEDLTDKQMAGFVASLREKQEEYEEEYLSRDDEEFHEEAYENLKDSLQDYMGRLDWGQRGILEESAAGLQRSDAAWLRERAAWLDRLEGILQREEGWQQALRDSLANRENTTSPEYLAIYEHNAAVIFEALAKVLSSRTEQQDRRLRRELGSLREDLETLIAKKT